MSFFFVLLTYLLRLTSYNLFRTSENKVPLLKPPPNVSRRNSSAVQSVSSSDTNSLEDLVSFDSPSVQSSISKNGSTEKRSVNRV